MGGRDRRGHSLIVWRRTANQSFKGSFKGMMHVMTSARQSHCRNAENLDGVNHVE